MKIALTLDADPVSRETNDYVRSLLDAGFGREEIDVLMPADHPREPYDGIVLGGGLDVDPARYGEERLEDCHVEPDPARDALDFRLLAEALRQQIPILGICRGLQVINVALGGTLIQDIPTTRPSGVSHSVKWPKNTQAHSVTLLAGSKLAEVLGRTSLEVNSRHHQAIDRLAPGLSASALAPDGLVEAVEKSDATYLLAVQWHPENLQGQRAAQDLFRSFYSAVEQNLSRVAASAGD